MYYIKIKVIPSTKSKMPFAKITKKGQVTIPASYRKKLGTSVVKIEMEGDRIIITPAKELGGIFQKYAFTDKPIEEIMEIERKAISDAFTERHNRSRR